MSYMLLQITEEVNIGFHICQQQYLLVSWYDMIYEYAIEGDINALYN